MLKTIIMGMVVFALSFFVATGFVNAQTATSTPSPTTTPATTITPTTTPSTPGAPNTGFGY